MKEKSEGATPAPAAQQTAPAEKIAPASKAIESKKPGADIKAQTAPTKMEPNADKSKAAQSPAMDKAKSAQTPSSPAEAKSTETKSGVNASDSKTSDSKPDAKPNTAQAPAKPGATTGQSSADTSGAVKLTTEQRTKITTIIRQQKVAPAQLNVSVRVGTRVPDSVRFYPLPVEVLVVYPEWRGYDYIMVGDEILVINPRTHEIVAIIEA
jgi:hypothetical protein